MIIRRGLVGIVLALLFYIVFYPISLWINNNFDGAQGSMVKTLQRMVFFIVELIIFVKMYKKDSIRSVLTIEGFMILDNYVQWIMLTVVFIVAVVFLYKKPARA